MINSHYYYNSYFIKVTFSPLARLVLINYQYWEFGSIVCYYDSPRFSLNGFCHFRYHLKHLEDLYDPEYFRS